MAADADTSAEQLSEEGSISTPIALSETDREPSEPPSLATQDGKNAEPNADTESAVTEDAADEATNDGGEADDEDEGSGGAESKPPMSRVRLATLVGIAVIVVLVAVVGWQGFRAYRSHQAQQQRELFVQMGRQGALNLTTIDWQHADADAKRIMDSATGAFYDDFASRQQPFIDVVKKAQSKSVGTIKYAGLESESGDQAAVLVAVSVKTSNLGAAEQEPRAWRMRISVQKIGEDVKVAKVEFVP